VCQFEFFPEFPDLNRLCPCLIFKAIFSGPFRPHVTIFLGEEEVFYLFGGILSIGKND